jgi:hypothetical protein
MAFNWVCPFCQHAQTVIGEAYNQTITPFYLKNMAEDELALERTAIVCSNADCRRTTVKVRIGNYETFSNTYSIRYELFEHTIRLDEFLAPRGSAKPQPDYIPAPIVEDYTEACLIRELSPKASATLIRRCLQGMIRDFAKISKPTLFKEIEALRAAVDDGTADRAISSETVDAIDQVRGIGNIGAHMEKDIDLIVEVDPGEAQALIELVEMLFEEWYGARHRRQTKLAHIADIAQDKKAVKGVLGAAPLGIAEADHSAQAAPLIEAAGDVNDAVAETFDPAWVEANLRDALSGVDKHNK